MSTNSPTLPAPGRNANISTRDYIIYLGNYPLPPETPIPYSTHLPQHNPLNLPYGPSEPTSTLVLTSPSSTFVDLRILKPLQDGDHLLPNQGGPMHRVEWAFAGTSTSATIPGREDEEIPVTHSTWRHDIDTRFLLHEAIPVDEGDMYDLGSGRALEFGHAFNEHLGHEVAYEEMWADLSIEPVFPHTTMKVCCVLKLDDKEGRAKGVIVRLGQFCQGLLRKGEGWVIERWEFEESEGGGAVGGSWKRTVRVGDMFLPCAVAFKREGVQVGTTVEVDGGTWVVDEYLEWTEDGNDVDGGDDNGDGEKNSGV
ncbi:hypothetical protein BU24DRAFT_428641 [Aaosphaeria arxii CBS 175.79]|uniref:Protein HRI1 n=1 Tax=Aaosphaeria arxii CBS 175.79 TaxID=1450172 RepID=A0A6A5XA22_9PLEO|nr:uncharacterized protein BU24DRAFT_428641 [Aaosphaeria arxii CBS 175.79]KAF2009770.1 hypothetical protein BU24DRAFT_428641 [Aaosphaeria arxii CBS 175.79]